MKKWIIAVVILGLVGYGWYSLRQTNVLSLGFLQGKMAVVSRGDLTIPITATGEIQPKSRSEMKPEASGEVREILCKPGQLVQRDEVLIRLDPDEEQRSASRAQNDVDRAKAALRQRELTLQDRRSASLQAMDARIAQAEAQLVDASFRLDKNRDLFKRDLETDEVMITTQARYDQLTAQRDGLLAERRQAEIAIDLAEQDVILASKALESAETTLHDAEKRLQDTTISSPIDGMITVIKVEVGEVVQEGRRNITGGTVVAVVADVSEIYVRTEVSDADIGAVLWLAPAQARPGGAEMADQLDDPAPLNVDTSGLLPKLQPEGTPVKIAVDAFRDDDFEGVIERIYPEPRKVQNIVTYLVDIRVTSPNARKLALVMGMQADVEFTAQSVRDAILMPHDAIRKGPTGQLGVFVPEMRPGEKNAQPAFVPCRFGLDNGLYAELLEGVGLTEGSKVYVQLPPEFSRSEDEEEKKK